MAHKRLNKKLVVALTLFVFFTVIVLSVLATISDCSGWVMS